VIEAFMELTIGFSTSVARKTRRNMLEFLRLKLKEDCGSFKSVQKFRKILEVKYNLTNF
jgi:hypothetical protein